MRGARMVDLWEPQQALTKRDPNAFRDLYQRMGAQGELWGHMTAAGNGFVAAALASTFSNLDCCRSAD